MSLNDPDNLSAQTARRAAELAFARQVLRAEADAVAAIQVDERFSEAVELILRQTQPPANGALVISGLGKSGLVGQKLSATFASTGTPSHFLHPAEAVHGDLGRIRRDDIVLLLSYSGATEEVLALAAILRQDKVATIALVSKPDCDIARLTSTTLCIGDITEACPHNLAPTASTTAMLALGDALALACSRRRNFGVDDFRKFHPGGGLGRQLTPVLDVIRFIAGQNLPLVPHTATLQQAYDQAEHTARETGLRRAGALVVVDDEGRLAGIFTDGDLRRLMFQVRRDDFLSAAIGQVMTPNPRHLQHTALVRDAVQLTRELRIDEIPIIDDQRRPVGMIDVQDLMALKVIQG